MKQDIFQATEDNDITALRAFLENSPKLLHSTDFRGDSLLHLAAEYGDSRMMAFLHEQGLNVNVERCRGRGVYTPLHVACNNGNIDNVRWLLSNGACLEAGAGRSGTPLVAAAYEGSLIVVKHLLDVGADATASYFLGEGDDQVQMNAVLIARQKGNDEVGDYLETLIHGEGDDGNTQLDRADSKGGANRSGHGITSAPLSDDHREMLDAAMSASLDQLPDIMHQSPPILVIDALQKHLDALFRKNIFRKKKSSPLGDDAPMAFGALLGSIICEAFGWRWIVATHSDSMGLGIVDKEQKYLFFPLSYMDDLFDNNGDTELSPKLIFNCIDGDKLPRSSPNQFLSLT